MSDSPPRPLELARLAARHLAERGVEDARLDAELLLAHVLGVRRLDLYLQFERPLGAAEVDAYRDAVRRRGKREPLQYITGQAAFRELTLAVDPRVLIPRPETEALVSAVRRVALGGGPGRIAHAGADAIAGVRPPRATGTMALDIGTGSGAIILSLLVEGVVERGVATDVSAGALAVAAANAERAGLAGRVEFRHGSLWEPIGPGERFDVIVSNPPYVGEAERAALMPEVREHEPVQALFADEHGLAVVRGIVQGAAGHLVGGGLLALELGLGQGPTVAGWLRDAGFPDPVIEKDLTGRERFVLAAVA